MQNNKWILQMCVSEKRRNEFEKLGLRGGVSGQGGVEYLWYIKFSKTKFKQIQLCGG